MSTKNIINPTKNSIVTNERGAALVVALIMLVIMTTMGVTVTSTSIVEGWLSANYRDSKQSFYVAEAGVERGLDWLRNQIYPPAGIDEFNPLGAGVAVPLGAGNYTIIIDPDDNNPVAILNRYRITSTGNVNGAIRSVVMEVEVENFARFSYFTNSEYFYWGGRAHTIWFVGGNRIQGPVHTNSHFHISGDPVFEGEVSSGDNFIDYMNPPPHGGNNPDFQQGLRLGVREIVMPTNTANLKAAANAVGGLLLTGDTTVELLNDGTMNVTNADRDWDEYNTNLPDNEVLYVDDGNLSISGTLNGRLTAGSDEDIIITDSILYNTDPRLDPTSQDMLGLVSDNDVIVAKQVPHNVEINATIMAIDGSFTVEQWWRGPPRGTLTVHGGIIQNSRGPVGTFNPRTGNRRSGFEKNYSYDDRVMVSPPSFFPTTGNYLTLFWKEQKGE